MQLGTQTSNSRPAVRCRAHGTPVDRINMIARRKLVGNCRSRFSTANTCPERTGSTAQRYDANPLVPGRTCAPSVADAYAGSLAQRPRATEPNEFPPSFSLGTQRVTRDPTCPGPDCRLISSLA